MRTRAVTAAALLAAILFPSCALLRNGGPSIPPVSEEGDVDMDPSVLEKFREEVVEYVELHRELRERVPTVADESTAAEIAAYRKRMTEAIREERRSAKRGDIFKPKVERAFRRILARELTGPDGPAMVQAIRQGNPRVEGVPAATNTAAERMKRFVVAVNAVYPDDAPLSSVPPSLLLELPTLPEQLKYRFVGRHLILRDTEANVILDYIPDVVPGSTVPR